MILGLGFAHSSRLALLLLVAALAVAYVVLQVVRRRYAVRFTNLDLLDTVAPKRPGWRRHVPAAGFIVLTALLAIAFAGPRREERVQRESAIVVMALDVSLSMAADDVEPTRIEAAQEAAQSFIDGLPEGILLGLVSFAGDTQVVAPTLDHGEIRDAIARQQLAEGTAIGEAVIDAISAIEAELAEIAESNGDGGDSGGNGDGDDERAPAVVVVMSDGEITAGRPADDAITVAIDAEIAVSTIAFGTEDGTIDVPGQGTVDVPVSERDLRALAEETGGRFFTAESLDELDLVYDDIGSAFGYDIELRDLTPRFVGAALVLALLTGALSLAWFSRLP